MPSLAAYAAEEPRVSSLTSLPSGTASAENGHQRSENENDRRRELGTQTDEEAERVARLLCARAQLDQFTAE
jgi:hypothetical protein